MMVSTYSAFAQSYINNRMPSQKFSSRMDNPLLHSTPDALTFELIDSLDSDRSGGLSQSESGLDNSNFHFMDRNNDDSIGYAELSARVETERNTYVELLFINSQYSAFSTLSEDGFLQMIDSESGGDSLMTTAFQTQERSDFQKIVALNQNLLYHTRLNPAVPTSTIEPEPVETTPSLSSDLYQIIAPLLNLDNRAVVL